MTPIDIKDISVGMVKLNSFSLMFPFDIKPKSNFFDS